VSPVAKYTNFRLFRIFGSALQPHRHYDFISPLSFLSMTERLEVLQTEVAKKPGPRTSTLAYSAAGIVYKH